MNLVRHRSFTVQCTREARFLPDFHKMWHSNRLLQLSSLCFLGFLMHATSSTRTAVIVCSDDSELEPSLSPRPMYDRETSSVMQQLKKYDREANTTRSLVFDKVLSTIRDIGEVDVPLKRLISHGIFHIDVTSEHFFFSEVLLVQHNFFLLNSVCSMIPKEYQNLKKMFCKCYSGDSLSVNENVLTYDGTGYFKKDMTNSYEWCVRNPCTDKSNRHGICQVHVDPFRSACILIPRSRSHISSVYDDINTIHHNEINIHHVPSEEPLKESNIALNIDHLISYNFSIPLFNETLCELENLFFNIGQYLNKDGVNLISGFGQPTDEYEALILTYIPDFSNIRSKMNNVSPFIPKYLLNMVIGFILVHHSGYIASLPAFRYIVAAVLGTNLALIGLTCCIHRSDGAFNIPWLGKAYLFVSMILSLFLTFSTGFLRPPSTTCDILKVLISYVGCCCLQNSTSSYEISFLLMSLICFGSHVRHFLCVIYMMVFKSHPSSKYTGIKMTLDDFDSQGQDYTKKALNLLSIHLSKNPHLVYNILSQDGSHVNSDLLHRFSRGEYSGLPETVETEATTTESDFDRVGGICQSESGIRGIGNYTASPLGDEGVEEGDDTDVKYLLNHTLSYSTLKLLIKIVTFVLIAWSISFHGLPE